MPANSPPTGVQGAGVRPARPRLHRERLLAALARLEPPGARLGVVVLDPADGTRVERRGDERFPHCSTFKLLLVAATLARVDTGAESLQRPIPFERGALVSWSPVTESHVGSPGMTVSQLCEATLTVSDNTAANLLIDALGGLPVLQRFIRAGGDGQTRVDRLEPLLNEATPGDPRDTTTPLAMALQVQRLLLGNTLRPASRSLLRSWLAATQTGKARLRHGVPAGWTVEEKTGSGEHGTNNDVGLVLPPNGPPLVVASYLTEHGGSMDEQNAVHAAVARAIVAALEAG